MKLVPAVLKLTLTGNHVAYLPFDLYSKYKAMENAFHSTSNGYADRLHAYIHADAYFAAEESFRKEVYGEPTGGEQWDATVKGLLDK